MNIRRSDRHTADRDTDRHTDRQTTGGHTNSRRRAGADRPMGVAGRSPAGTARSRKEARPTLFTPAFTALTIASLAYFTAIGMLLPALPRYVAGPLGGGNVAVGLVFGAFSVTAVLARPAAGVYGDRRGRRPLLLMGAALFAVTVLGYELAGTTATLLGLRLVGGVGEAMFFVGMVTTFSDLAPAERRGEAMSLASLALYLGIGAGPPIAEVIVAVSGFTAVWVTAAAGALAAAALTRRVPETRPAAPAGDEGTAARARGRLVHPAGLLPGVLLFASIVGMAGFLAFVPLHVLDIGMSGSSLVLLVFAAVVALIRAFGARLPDVLGPARAIRAALVLSGVGLSLVGLWHSAVGVLLGAVVLGAGIALLTPSVFALAVSRVPASERSQVVATTSAFIDIAFGAGPVALGFVAATLGRPTVFLVSALVAASGLAVLAGGRLARSGGRVELDEPGAAGEVEDPPRQVQRAQPPAIAPTSRNGSRPETTASGSGVSAVASE